MEIEFRDDTISKATGATFLQSDESTTAFVCKDNKATSPVSACKMMPDIYKDIKILKPDIKIIFLSGKLTSTDTSAIKTLYCKFELIDPDSQRKKVCHSGDNTYY